MNNTFFKPNQGFQQPFQGNIPKQNPQQFQPNQGQPNYPNFNPQFNQPFQMPQKPQQNNQFGNVPNPIIPQNNIQNIGNAQNWNVQNPVNAQLQGNNQNINPQVLNVGNPYGQNNYQNPIPQGNQAQNVQSPKQQEVPLQSDATMQQEKQKNRIADKKAWEEIKQKCQERQKKRSEEYKDRLVLVNTQFD